MGLDMEGFLARLQNVERYQAGLKALKLEEEEDSKRREEDSKRREEDSKRREDRRVQRTEMLEARL